LAAWATARGLPRSGAAIRRASGNSATRILVKAGEAAWKAAKWRAVRPELVVAERMFRLTFFEAEIIASKREGGKEGVYDATWAAVTFSAVGESRVEVRRVR